MGERRSAEEKGLRDETAEQKRVHTGLRSTGNNGERRGLRRARARRALGPTMLMCVAMDLESAMDTPRSRIAAPCCLRLWATEKTKREQAVTEVPAAEKRRVYF